MNNILITGGSGDIGAEIIKHLASKENRIFLHIIEIIKMPIIFIKD